MPGWAFHTGPTALDDATRWLNRHLPQETTPQMVRTVPFKMAQLYPKQLAMVDDPARFTITEATTKAGKTMSHLEWLLDLAAKTGYGNFWWVAPVRSQATMVFERARRRLQGYLLKKGTYIKVADATPFDYRLSNKTISLGGATIFFLSADNPDTLYGEDVMAAVGDEVTRWKEAAWTALYTTLTATAGRAKLIGNVKGRSNWAYKKARVAEKQEDPDWSYHKITAYDAIEGGVVEAETVEQAKRHMKEDDFKELYLAEASEDGGNPFGVLNIENMMMDDPAPGPTVAYGVDLGDKVDYTWIVGLNEAGEQTTSVRFNRIGWEAQIPRIAKIIGGKPALCDATGLGTGIFMQLKKKCRRMLPFEFTPGPRGTRQRLLRDLELDIDSGGVRIYDDRIKAELLLCERRYNTRGDLTYHLPEGEHDDGMMGLGMATKCLREMVQKANVR